MYFIGGRTCSAKQINFISDGSYACVPICCTEAAKACTGFRFGVKLKNIVTSGNDLFEANSSNVSSHTMNYVRSGTSIRVVLSITTAVAIADTEVSLGTLNIAGLGANVLHYSLNQYPGASDAGNCIPIFKLNYSTGALSVVDIIGQTSGNIDSGKALVLDFTVPISYTTMLDDFCNKFYWQRTA